MQAESAKYLYDIRGAAEKVAAFIEGCDLAAYSRDVLRRSAVERQCEIIGEALAQLARLDPATASRIPEHPRIIAFRNILIHGYAEVDARIVWDIVTTKLPPLHARVEELIREAGAP